MRPWNSISFKFLSKVTVAYKNKSENELFTCGYFFPDLRLIREFLLRPGIYFWCPQIGVLLTLYEITHLNRWCLLNFLPSQNHSFPLVKTKLCFSISQNSTPHILCKSFHFSCHDLDLILVSVIFRQRVHSHHFPASKIGKFNRVQRHSCAQCSLSHTRKL